MFRGAKRGAFRPLPPMARPARHAPLNAPRRLAVLGCRTLLLFQKGAAFDLGISFCVLRVPHVSRRETWGFSAPSTNGSTSATRALKCAAPFGCTWVPHPFAFSKGCGF